MSNGRAGPGQPPPPDYASEANTVIGVSAFLCAWATVFVAVRIYTRARIVQKVGIDDYLAVVSLVRPTYGRLVAKRG
jgi:hypothetical protein